MFLCVRVQLCVCALNERMFFCVSACVHVCICVCRQLCVSTCVACVCINVRRSPLRPRSTHTPPMPSDATGGWPCLHPPCVTLQRTRAHAAARIHARACPCLHAQRRIRTQYLSHTTHLCAHAHAHSQTDRFTHSDGISQERHTQTHTCTHMHTRVHAQLPTYTHTHT